MDEPPRKRPTPARDTLDILRRLEPVMLRAATDIVTLRQGLADLTVAGDARSSAQTADGPEIGERVERLIRGFEDLTRVYAGMRASVDRLQENQDQLRQEQGRLVQGWAHHEDGQERLFSAQGVVLDSVVRLRESLAEHHTDVMSGRNTMIEEIFRLREAQRRMADDQALYLAGQKAMGDLLTHLDERMRFQGRHLGAIRRDINGLPVLWVLAALAFAAAGATVVFLRLHFS